ncbi:class I SAM-dependent methyltransferase [Vreelandella massiliensis]|uniref:class I SAM-dependent methyltransferase n=1 Tax=Vreelandella massiliensis TaxID=1816686 RepID=UPI00096AC351|nr:class I SAM-dependent methyltransferase [Halomonas massiliensis]
MGALNDAVLNTTPVAACDVDGDDEAMGGEAISHDAFDSLIRRYDKSYRELKAIAEFMAHHGHDTQLLDMFFKGNITDHRVNSVSSLYYDRIFQLEGAVKALDARFWQEALALTNVMSLLPAKRRNEWNDVISRMKTPPFTADNLRATFTELFAQRKNYFAERVDGIFRALSHEHVTNRPEGFSKRLITYVSRCVSLLVPSDTAYLEDLRQVIAIVLKREIPKDFSTGIYWLLDRIIKTNRTGEWFPVDGNAFRLRFYKKGTVHVEIHPDVAWQLNKVLAHLYPEAIPNQHKTPRKRSKAIQVKPLTTPLPRPVLSALYNDFYGQRSPCRFVISRANNRFVREQLIDVLTQIGGQSEDGRVFDFDYPIGPVVDDIVFSGCIPNAKSHQFYPTPETLAASVVNLLDIQTEDRVLEPSAGTGAIAERLPSEQLTCVEYAPLHCGILKAKGITDVVEADFLEWSASQHRCFDKIGLNPPYTGGQAEAHLDAAIRCLAPGGRLVAILPHSLSSSWQPECEQRVSVEWQSPMHDAFPGVAISTAIAVVKKKAQ